MQSMETMMSTLIQTAGLQLLATTTEETLSFWYAKLEAFYEMKFYGFTVGDLVVSFAIILITFLLKNILTKVVFRALSNLFSKTTTDIDNRLLEAARKPLMVFITVFGVYMAIVVFPLDNEWQKTVNLIYRAVSMGNFFWLLWRLSDVLMDVVAYNAQERGASVGDFMPIIKKTLRVFLAVVGLIMIIDNLGYSVSGILATFGLGGAALALASKDTIANLYGAVSIAVDRPFKVGDWIQVGDKVDGDVEEIGIRSTRVRTWPKAVTVIPNSVLCNEYIVNWSRMNKRRVRQIVGVTYETKPEQMQQLLEDIRQLLKNDPDVNQEFVLVQFQDFGASSLDIMVYYFTNTTKWQPHMAVRERINLEIMKLVAKNGCSIAFPTRTVYFEGDIARKMAEKSEERTA